MNCHPERSEGYAVRRNANPHSNRDDKTRGEFAFRYQEPDALVAHAFSPPKPFSAGASLGKVNLKVEPCPASDSTQIFPPQCSTIFLQMANPIPLPRYSVRVCRRWKTTKIFSACSGAMPIPLSLTLNNHCSPAFSACTEIIGRSCPRNLIAFPIRFWKICAICEQFAHTAGSAACVITAPLS